MPDPVCQNNPVTFSDTSASNFSTIVSRLWSFGTGITSTSVTPTHAFTVSGFVPVTLIVIDGLGCTGISTQYVTVTPGPPLISGLLSVCMGATTTLSDSGDGTWSSSNTSVATIDTAGIVNAITPGYRVISYAPLTGCITTATVTVSPLPAADYRRYNGMSGLSATLSNATAGGTWSSTGTILAVGGTTGIVHTFGPGSGP